MANHKQAEKRSRQRDKRTIRNRHLRSTMRTFVKRVRAAVESGNGTEATEALKSAIRNIDKAASKGVVHRRTASRTISRLTVAVNKVVKPAS